MFASKNGVAPLYSIYYLQSYNYKLLFMYKFMQFLARHQNCRRRRTYHDIRDVGKFSGYKWSSLWLR